MQIPRRSELPREIERDTSFSSFFLSRGGSKDTCLKKSFFESQRERESTFLLEQILIFPFPSCRNSKHTDVIRNFIRFSCNMSHVWEHQRALSVNHENSDDMRSYTAPIIYPNIDSCIVVIIIVQWSSLNRSWNLRIEYRFETE